MKLPIWSFGVGLRILRSLNIWINKEGFIMRFVLFRIPHAQYLFHNLFNPHSAGAMRLYTLSLLPSLRRATRSNSSTILGTNITRIRIVPKTRMCGRKAGVRVILRGVSVGFGFFWVWYWMKAGILMYIFFCLDYDGYSCMSKWDRFVETR